MGNLPYRPPAVDLQLPILTRSVDFCFANISSESVNTALGNKPLTKLSFFAGLRRARYAAFYSIPGTREPEDLGTVDDGDTEGIVLIKGSRNDRYPHMLKLLLYLHRIIHIRR